MRQPTSETFWKDHDTMNPPHATAFWRTTSLAVALGCACAAVAQGARLTPLSQPASTQQLSFASAQAAADALEAAWRSSDKPRLMGIFGRQGWKLVSSGDPVADRAAAARFVAAYDANHRIESMSADKATLLLGPEGFPYPIPLVQIRHRWRFDSAAGEQEILDRRIGRNELHVIEVCHELVQAQREYAAADPLGSGQHGYATKIISSPNRHDGLYWEASGEATQSPLGPLVASAVAEGYAITPAHHPEPYHGYLYRLISLPVKAVAAPGAKARNVAHLLNAANGTLGAGSAGRAGNSGSAVSTGSTGSTGNADVNPGTKVPHPADSAPAPAHQAYAFLVYPARYADLGIMTFAVTQDGIVYQKDLGRHTAAIVMRMRDFKPDVTWDVP